MEGVPDPDLLPDDIVNVEEPKVGADKIYYPVGFGQKPILALVELMHQKVMSEHSKEPQDLLNKHTHLYLLVMIVHLNAAISARNTAEAALSGSNSFPEKVSLVNSSGQREMNLNITIWAYRTHDW